MRRVVRWRSEKQGQVWLFSRSNVRGLGIFRVMAESAPPGAAVRDAGRQQFAGKSNVQFPSMPGEQPELDLNQADSAVSGKISRD